MSGTVKGPGSDVDDARVASINANASTSTSAICPGISFFASTSISTVMSFAFGPVVGATTLSSSMSLGPLFVCSISISADDDDGMPLVGMPPSSGPVSSISSTRVSSIRV